MTLLAINNGRDRPEVLDLPMASTRYTLSAPRLESATILLNGKMLALGPHDALPPLEGVPAPAGRMKLAPTTISFIAFADAHAPRCH